MKNLLTALYTKLSGSALFNDTGGRIFTDQAPEGVDFPYVVVFIVSSVQDKTFTEVFTDTVIQFSLFSASESVLEITTMYADLKALLDDCSLSITGSTLLWCRENNLATMMEEITVGDATQQVRHWAVDYEIKTSLN